MTTATFDSQPGGTQTLATFKGWAEGFHNALIAVGLVQTADTGQLDFAAVTVLPTASTTVGYIIYRFDDTMQATAPLFLRIEYKVGASSRARIDILVGTSTDGAGTLNAFRAVSVVAGTTTTDGSPLSSYIAAGDGYLTLALFGSTFSPNYGCSMFVVERSRQVVSGVDTPTGAGVLIARTMTDVATYGYGSKVELSHSYGFTFPGFGTTKSAGLGLTPVLPCVVFLAGGVPWQPISFVGVLPADSPIVPFDVTINGVSRTYQVPLLASGQGMISNGTTSYSSATAVLYS